MKPVRSTLASMAMVAAALGVPLPLPVRKERQEKEPDVGDAERLEEARTKREKRAVKRLAAFRIRELDRRAKEMK